MAKVYIKTISVNKIARNKRPYGHGSNNNVSTESKTTSQDGLYLYQEYLNTGTSTDAELVWKQNIVDLSVKMVAALGHGHELHGNLSTILGGYGNITRAYRETVMGSYATDIPGNPEEWEIDDRLFEIGKGADPDNRDFALRIYKSGLIMLSNALLVGAFETGELEPVDGMIQFVNNKLQLFLGEWKDIALKNAETQPTWISAEYRDIEAGTADSHVLLLKALYDFKITSCVLKLDNGTLEISFLKNGAEITGISAISATTTKTETFATGNNAVSIGDELAISWSTVYTGNPSAIIVQLNIDTALAEQIPVTSISITGDSTGVAGNTIQLTALITPSNATNQSVSWSSSDTSKATVNSSGLVTLIAEGPVTITATASDGSGVTGTKSLTITASNIAVSSISVLGDSVDVQGNTIQLSAAVLPANATNKAVTWSSSDTSKATVDSTGLVTLIAAGSVTITATSSDGSGVSGTKQLTIEAAIIPPTVSNLSFTRTSDSAFNVAATIDTKNQDAYVYLEYGLTEEYGNTNDITGETPANGSAVTVSTTLEF